MSQASPAVSASPTPRDLFGQCVERVETWRRIGHAGDMQNFDDQIREYVQVRYIESARVRTPVNLRLKSGDPGTRGKFD